MKTTSTGNGKGAPEQGSSAHAVIPVAGCRNKREWEQFGPTFDVPASVAAKKGGLGKERNQPAAPAAGSRSKEEWEQPTLTLVRPGNVAVKNEGSCNKRPDKQRNDEQKWDWVIPKKEAAQSAAAKSAGSGGVRPNKASGSGSA